MCTTRRLQADGGGATQTNNASARHITIAACLFVMVLRTFAGMYRRGDQREGVLGDVQKLVEEEAELDEDDDE